MASAPRISNIRVVMSFEIKLHNGTNMPAKQAILVIEADSHLRNTLGIILQRAGYQISTAEHASTAIQYLRDNAFNLVLFDMNLPYDESTYLFSELPALCKGRLPFLVLSEFPAMDLSGQVKDPLTCHYFLKPVDPDLLLCCVRDLLLDPLN